jgi:hypothetical protein
MRSLAGLICISMCLFAHSALAQTKTFTLAAPPALVESGLLKFMLPRFSLKTSIRITVVAPGTSADATFSMDGDGRPVFKGPDDVWRLSHSGTDFTERFAEWIVSDVGKRTIESFKTEGVAVFSARFDDVVEEEVIEITGDTNLGEALSLQMCGRCHVISEKNKYNGLGSTPSFAVMRTFRDWDTRFQTFFLLKPHGAFTQIDGVTDPFPADRPSPIVPIELTLDELDAILAYTATIPPADLGAPIRSQ